MHCASCALIIEKQVLKVEGVKKANVNFAAEKAIIFYDEPATVEGIIGKIKNAGYEATVVDEKDTEFARRKREVEIANYGKKFIFSLVLILPMLYFLCQL